MPFDFQEYQKKCNGMTTEQLNQEWDNYTRQITSGATSTPSSVLLSVFTGGVSLAGQGFSAPRIHNARKKREIIEAGLQARGTTHHTHVKDVPVPMATVGACNGITKGISGAELLPTTAGAGDAVVEYATTRAAASGVMTFIRYKANELSKKKWGEMPEAGLHASNTWPLGPPDKERFPAGGQFPPTVHDYSLFGHHEDEELQGQSAQLTVQTETVETMFSSPQVTPLSPSSPDSVDAYHIPLYENSQNLNGTSLSWQISTSASAIPQAQQEYTTSRQAFQEVEEFGLLSPDGTIRQAVSSTDSATISDSELDHLVATLTDEEQMLLLMKLELELRTGHSQPPLHRSSHVHASHGRRHHIKTEGELAARRSSEKAHSSSDLTTTPQLSLPSSDEQHHSDQLAPILPPRSPSLPVRPYPSQAPQLPAMPPRSASLQVGVGASQTPQPPPLPSRAPSLPVGLGISENPAASSVQHSQIHRKPMPTSQQSYPPNPTWSQFQQPQLKDQRQDSGYYSTTTTPSLPSSSDVPPCYSPQSFSPAPNLPQKFTSQAPAHRDSQFSFSSTSPNSQPPPPYFAYPTVAEPSSFDGFKDYFNQATTPNTSSNNSAEYATSSGPKEGHNILGSQGWQWGTVFTSGTSDEKLKAPGEPDYGPPPPIPGAWKG